MVATLLTMRKGGHLVLLVLVPALALSAACSSDSHDSASGSVEAPAGAFPDNRAKSTPVKIGLINPEGGPAISQPSNREAAQAAVECRGGQVGYSFGSDRSRIVMVSSPRVISKLVY